MKVADAIGIRARFARSANLERDADTAALSDYVPTARALDLIRRFATACVDPERPRAWSVSGPYGSGKSSVALLLDTLFGHSSISARNHALELIRAADPDLATLVERAHHVLGTEDRGMIRAVVTADPERVTESVLRALERGVRRYWPRGPKPPAAAAVLDVCAEASAGGASVAPHDLVVLLRGLVQHAPLLLLVDEFGKNLEYHSERPAEGDLYVLQAIAESASGRRGLPIYLLTLQHMSFDAYAAAGSAAQRREWAKVQGRFEDVLFLDSPEQTVRLMGRVFEVADPKSPIAARIVSEAKYGAAVTRGLGLSDVIGDEAVLARTYPLHPTVVAALPELCRRYGQNERTLFSFLSHDEPHAVGEFVSSTELPRRGALPTVRLADVFDYFVGSVTPSLGVTPESARWFEIHDRIAQAIGLDPTEVAVLKSIGVLNLVAQGGALRASRAMLAYALGPADREQSVDSLAQTLAGLEERGFITYRAFADEYRLWQGSDFDIEGRIALERKQFEGVPVGQLIQSQVPLPPVVASRYSQQRGIVRTFARRVLDTLDDLPRTEAEGSDGLIVYVLSADSPADGRSSEVRPAVIAIHAPQLTSLREPVIEAAATRAALTTAPNIDWVARRELEERAGQALAAVQATTESLLRFPGDAFLLGPGAPVALPRAGTVSELASTVCDRTYGEAPVVRNEMLSRATLTSQAARARIDLLTAMVSAPHAPRLGIDGFGPERAMYEAILARSGIHQSAGDRWAFGPPSADGYRSAWDRIDELVAGSLEGQVSVAEIEQALRRPPIGLNSPMVPILLTAYLLAEPDQVAVYQDGVFQPRLTPDLLERLTKAPERFRLRYVAVEGPRLKVLRALATEFGVILRSSSRQRTAPVLSVVAPLLEILRALPEYSQQTTELSPVAAAVREALLSAREPDQLVFADLPTALGLRPLYSPDDAAARTYASALQRTLNELREAYPKLLDRIANTVSGALALNSRNTLKIEAAARARPLLGQVVEPRLRALLYAMSSDTLDDEDWLEAIALAISERPPKTWQAADVARFEAQAASLLGSFRRVEALYFDGRASSPSGFIPRRITVTAPNGSELTRVVWVDEAQLPLLRQLLDETRTKVADLLPMLGEEALLATFAEQVLASRDNPDDLPASRSSVDGDKKVGYGR